MQRGVGAAEYVGPREPDHADQQIDQHGALGIDDVVAQDAVLVVREHVPLNDPPPLR